MQSSRIRLLASLLAVAPVLALAGGERPMVKVGCEPTDEKLVFHCAFDVMGKKSHDPIEDAAFKVNADMPTMPLAHNVRPIRPEPVAGAPGRYEGRLELEMLGEWAIRMTFDQPVRDIVIEKVTSATRRRRWTTRRCATERLPPSPLEGRARHEPRGHHDASPGEVWVSPGAAQPLPAAEPGVPVRSAKVRAPAATKSLAWV